MPNPKNGYIPRLLPTEYASYRDIVARTLTARLAEAQQSRSRPLVLYDPMAGTAPLLPEAERCGYTAHFNDLNSLHWYVNAAKTHQSYSTFMEIGPDRLLSIICDMAPGLSRCRRTATENWMEDDVLERLTTAWKRTAGQEPRLAKLTRAILLLAVRGFSSFVRTKNPTWLKPGGLRRKASAKKVFGDAVKKLGDFYERAYANGCARKGGRIILTHFDATRCAPKGEVDVIATSPPFCNRVDWDRLYAPEHFFLSAVGVWHTRAEFLGTTAVHEYSDFDLDFEFVRGRSPYLDGFLKLVRERQIEGERGSDYYVRYFTRYFAGLFRVFDRAAGALRKDSAGIYVVVQENAHRGVLIKIGTALADSLQSQGFCTSALDTWEWHHLGLQNISRRHTLVTPKQRECIWHAVRTS
jgi:hypothetical protein